MHFMTQPKSVCLFVFVYLRQSLIKFKLALIELGCADEAGLLTSDPLTTIPQLL